MEDRNTRTLWCPPHLITPIFVVFDLGAFFIQFLGACAVGAAYSSKELTAGQREEKMRKGRSALQLGLVLQLICFGLFAVVGTRLIVVSRRWLDKDVPYGAPRAQWRRLNWTVNVTATIIMVGSCRGGRGLKALLTGYRSVLSTGCLSLWRRAANRVMFNRTSGRFGY